MSLRPRAGLAAAILGLPAGALAAQDGPNHLLDRFQVNASASALVLSSTIRIDPHGGTGTEIDAEEALGLNRVALEPRLSFRWKPGRRHELELGGSSLAARQRRFLAIPSPSIRPPFRPASA